MIELNTNIIEHPSGAIKAEGNIEGALKDGLNLMQDPDRLEAWLMEEHINIHKAQAVAWVLEHEGHGAKMETELRLCSHGLKACVSVTLVKMKMNTDLTKEEEKYIEELIKCWETEPVQIDMPDVSLN